MVHFNIQPRHHYEDREVYNEPCQHAFIMVGEETLFGVHMTQYHCEKHMYQVILKLTLPPEAEAEFLRQRKMHPDDTFILCNRIEDKFSIPNLGSHTKKTFQGAIYHGFRPPPDPEPEGWFPWNDQETLAMIGKMEVTVERVVLFRPFAHHEPAPPFATYYMFGEGDEAHMTNLQTAQLLTGPFEVPLYGLDVDHVMSLQSRPEWLDPDMLRAGIAVGLPAIRRTDPETGKTFLLEKPPFESGNSVHVLYRGVQPPRAVKAGPTYLWASAVCNSPPLTEPGVTPNMSMIISDMPKKYWI